MKLTTLLLIALASTTAFLAADRSQADPMEGVRYVDMQRCLQEWPALQAQSESLQATYTAMRNQFQSQGLDLQSREAALEEFDPASTQYQDAAFQLDLDGKTLKARVDWAGKRLRDDQASLLARGVAKIHQAARQLGADRGYSAVLMAPMALPDATGNLGEQLRDLESRWVMWSNPSYDVTNDVLQILSAEE